MSKFTSVASIVCCVMALLTGCAGPGGMYIDLPDTYAFAGNPKQFLTNPKFPETGFVYTRALSYSYAPYYFYNPRESGGLDNTSTTFVLDFGLEMKQLEGTRYYRVHFMPKTMQAQDAINLQPWLKIELRQSYQDDNASTLYVSLPEQRYHNRSFTTEWFSCSGCFSQGTEYFDELMTSAKFFNQVLYYRGVKAPEVIPDWQGDIAQIEEAIEQRKQQQLAAVEAEKRRQLEALESSLPAEVLRDKYMVSLSGALKSEDYRSALVIFPKLEKLPLPLDPSLQFFYGETLINVGEIKAGIAKLYQYISAQGSQATHYAKALQLITEAETKLVEQ